MAFDGLELSKLIGAQDTVSALAELRTIGKLISPTLDFDPVEVVFKDIIRLFNGDYPGYRKCNTFYHDLKHTLDVALAMSRMIHGAVIEGSKFSDENVSLGIISALVHDAGYIQTLDDTEGSGAKYTQIHIQRSIDFAEGYFRRMSFPEHQIEDCRDILNCTGLATHLADISFHSVEIQSLGRMLGTADLLGQMSDRLYLEKLLYLYYEFKEADIAGYSSAEELLRKTLNFYSVTFQRFESELGGVQKYMKSHFKVRWDIDEDVYMQAINKNKAYLEFIKDHPEENYRDFLRRGGIVETLRKQGM